MMLSGDNRPVEPTTYVVIGTSAGGSTALMQILRDLPGDFPAVLLIVMHVSEKGKAWLAERLSSVSRIPVLTAEDGAPLRPGFAHVAPPGRHLFVDEAHVRLGEGEPEQRARPAIDVLFRSAARVFGPRVIGVVLTGMLRDGTLGLRAVRDAGGLTIVQNPETAEAREMPLSAMQGVVADYCLDLPEIGPALDLLARRTGARHAQVLETGLASSVRLMTQRASLLAKLLSQSVGNPKTLGFLAGEADALERSIQEIQTLIAASRASSPPRGRER